jgi:competence protein ComEC
VRESLLCILVGALPLLAACAGDERNPFDPEEDSRPPSLTQFEIIVENQSAWAAWAASEPVRAVVEYSDPAVPANYHSYPAERGFTEAGLIELVGVRSSTQYALAGLRLTDRAGNETTALPEGVSSFTTGPVSQGNLLYFAMIDVGWGDALYLEAADGTNVLIDAGHPIEPDARPPTGVHPVRWFLDKRGVTRLDFASLSHVHEDHIGGFYGDDFELIDGLFQNQGGTKQPISVGTFLDILDKTPGTINGPYGDLAAALELLQGAGDLDAWVLLPAGASSAAGEPALAWGADLRVDLLAAGKKDFLLPDFILGEAAGSVQNNDSMVYRVQFGSFVLLLTGDGEFATEQYLENRYPGDFLRATVLKLGHHGSNDANSERFLSLVDPVVALISNAVSENPGVQHPFVLGRLRNAGVDYFASDRAIPNRDRALRGVRGDVHILTDGAGFTVIVDNLLYE